MAELTFAEEVLVGKAEMDEKRQRIMELELQVGSHPVSIATRRTAEGALTAFGHGFDPK